MKTVNPYLNFPGTAEEAFNFYKSVFGGEFATLQRLKTRRKPAGYRPMKPIRSCIFLCH